MIILKNILLLFLSIFSSAFATGPYCPSAPANCSFKNVQDGLKDLKDDRFFGLLTSPDSACKAHLMKGIKPESVLPELMADPRFAAYITPQISQCWKEGGSNSAKLETLSRYAYIQRRLDETADHLLDYQVFADSVLGNEPLSSIPDCKKAAPELAGLVKKCSELKATCKKNDMAQTLAQSFIDDYKSQDIKNIEKQFQNNKKILESCRNSHSRSGYPVATKHVATEQCKTAKAMVIMSAVLLQIFYTNYPWAQEDKFQDMVGKRSFDVSDLALVTKALKKQVADNSRHIGNQIKDLTSASQCLLRNNCDSSTVNDVLERTKPLADQHFLKKGESNDSFRNRAAVSSFVSYNNCLDHLGEAQRKTSATMWSSSIGAAGAILTGGGSIVLTGLTTGGRAVVGAAVVGSRAASASKLSLTLGLGVDGGITAQSIYDASGRCGSKSTGYFKQAEKLSGPRACGIPTAEQMQFKKEYDGCILDIVLGAAGGAGLLVGLKNLNTAKKIASETEQASGAIKTNSLPPSLKPNGASADATETVAKAIDSIAEKPKIPVTMTTATAEKVSAHEASLNPFKKKNSNQNLERSAIKNISEGSSPETIRSVVGKLDDKLDNGEARLKIAAKILGRDANHPLTDAEKKWIMAAHNKHTNTAYGSIGTQKVRDKIKAGEGRPSSISNKETRDLMEYGIMGSESVSSVVRRADIPNSALNGQNTLTVIKDGKTWDVVITDSKVVDGIIYHKIEIPGRPGYIPIKESDLLLAIKPKEAPTSQLATAASSPTLSTTPTSATATPLRKEPRSINATAANDIEALNQSQMKTVVNHSRPEHLNGQSTPKSTRLREVYGRDLGISDANRRAAIAYAPVADSKTMTSAVQKALGNDSKVDIKQLRQTMSFNPSSGYVSANEFANAARFVEEINAKGGVKALDALSLSTREREVLNAILARAPSYASYADPKVRPLGQMKVRKGPLEATNPNRDVVVTDAQGQTVQGKETIRQLATDGESLSTVQYTNTNGTKSSITVPTSRTMDVAEAKRLNNYDQALSERANANRAHRVAASEQPTYVNPHGVSRAQLGAQSEVVVKIQALDGVKEVEAIVQGKPFKGATGLQEIQIRYPDGVDNGKTVYKYASVSIDDVEKIKPAPVPVVPKMDPVNYKPINAEIRNPVGPQITETTYEGKQFRNAADAEAAEILTDRRIGTRAHIDSLKPSVSADYDLVQEIRQVDSNIRHVSQKGLTSDSRFNPRIFYQHQADQHHVIMSAPKEPQNSALREQISRTFKGTIHYNDDGTTKYVNSARDVAIRTAHQQGMSSDEIAKLEKWIDAYDQAAPRIRAYERAVAAQKDFDGMKTILANAIKNDSTQHPISSQTFEKLAQSLNDMQLNSEQKRVAEIALKKIRCSRPEWKIKDNQFLYFNLKCD